MRTDSMECHGHVKRDLSEPSFRQARRGASAMHRSGALGGLCHNSHDPTNTYAPGSPAHKQHVTMQLLGGKADLPARLIPLRAI